MNVYPLLEILLYLAIIFVPSDRDRIAISGLGLNGTVELTRNGTEWSFQQGRVSISENQVVLEGIKGKVETSVGDYVASAKGFDWTKNQVLTLALSTRLEKTADGFIFRRNQNPGEEISCRIIYSRMEASPSQKIVVNVLGQVKQPGSYEIPRNGSLIDALAAAGSWTEHAGLKRVSVIRGPAGERPTVMEYDVNAMLKGTVAAPRLQQRDTVYVPESVVSF